MHAFSKTPYHTKMQDVAAHIPGSDVALRCQNTFDSALRLLFSSSTGMLAASVRIQNPSCAWGALISGTSMARSVCHKSFSTILVPQDGHLASGRTGWRSVGEQAANLHKWAPHLALIYALITSRRCAPSFFTR